MPEPNTQGVCPFQCPTLPVASADPQQARPIGVGEVAKQGQTFHLKIKTDSFSAPVDLYVAIQLATLAPDEIYCLDPNHAITPLSLKGLVKWRSAVTAGIEASLFPPMPVALLPGDT
jgi:hypothetical protein